MTFRTGSTARGSLDSLFSSAFRAHLASLSAIALLAATAGVGQAQVASTGQQATLRLNMLDNGDMEMGSYLGQNGGAPRIPWWTPATFAPGTRDLSRAQRNWDGLTAAPSVVDGVLVMGSDGPDLLTQPIAAYGPMVSGLRVSGRVLGRGSLVLIDGKGREVVSSIGSAQADGWKEFSWEASAKADLQPRLVFGVGPAGDAEVRFDDLEVSVVLPAPTEAQLEAELATLIPELLWTWHRGTRDSYGPRETTLWAGGLDGDSGQLSGVPPARVGLHPMHGLLVSAVHLGLGGAELRDLCIASARDFMELCIHPGTGLPRRWAVGTDQPVDDEMLEAAAYLGYLLDLVQKGPIEVRVEALTKATEMGRALHKATVLPDGNVAALVRPSNGEISTSTVHLRRLDLPSRFARLGAILQARNTEPELRADLIAAAKDAVLEVEFANYWPGTWSTIDPGFDDSYGHIGARSMAMLKALPGEPMLGRLAFSGYDRYAPLWRDAMSLGGNIAADQVRCWRVLAELVTLQPERKTDSGTSLQAEVSELLAMAVRSHYKGEQSAAGHWLDVTVVGFDPATNLPVGDTAGIPQNLLDGLGAAYRSELGLRTAEHRALFATVLASTRESYAAKFGLVGSAPGTSSAGRGGGKSAVGTLLILPGLLAMAENLRR
jgi:hypothetical protein